MESDTFRPVRRRTKSRMKSCRILRPSADPKGLAAAAKGDLLGVGTGAAFQRKGSSRVQTAAGGGPGVRRSQGGGLTPSSNAATSISIAGERFDLSERMVGQNRETLGT